MEVSCPAAVLMGLDAAPATVVQAVRGLERAPLWMDALAAFHSSTHAAAPLFGGGHAGDGDAPTSPDDRSAVTSAPAPVKASSGQHIDDFFAVAAELGRLADELGGPPAVSDASGPAPKTLQEIGVELLPDAIVADYLCAAEMRALHPAELLRALALFDGARYEEAGRVLSGLLEDAPRPDSDALLLNSIAACSFRAEDWAAAGRLSEQALRACDGFDVALRRLCRIAIITGDAAQARRHLAPRRQLGRWRQEREGVEALERCQALLQARRPAEAIDHVAQLCAAFPCGRLEAWRVQLMLSEGRRATAAYAREQHQRFPRSAELNYWRCRSLFECARTVEELEAVRRDVADAVQRSTAAQQLRALEAAVQSAATALARAEALAKVQRWDELIAHCTSFLAGAGSVTSDGVTQALYTHRAHAYAQAGATYPALDDAQRALRYAEDEDSMAALLSLVAGCEERLGRLRDAVYHARQAQRMAPSSDRAAHTRRLEQALERERQRERQAEAAEAAAREPPPPPGAKPQQQRRRSGGARPPPVDAAAAAPSPHVILCLPPDVDDVQVVKRSYRALAMRWHPDKWSGRSDAEVREAEAQFKTIQNAYETILARLKKDQGD